MAQFAVERQRMSSEKWNEVTAAVLRAHGGERFPLLRQTLAGKPTDVDVLGFALDRVLDGVALHVEQRRAARSTRRPRRRR